MIFHRLLTDEVYAAGLRHVRRRFPCPSLVHSGRGPSRSTLGECSLRRLQPAHESSSRTRGAVQIGPS